MRYKLIAIDLDDTLLNSQGRLSVKNEAAIIAAVGSGLDVVFASGRMPQAITKYMTNLPKLLYLIFFINSIMVKYFLSSATKTPSCL